MEKSVSILIVDENEELRSQTKEQLKKYMILYTIKLGDRATTWTGLKQDMKEKIQIL